MYSPEYKALQERFHRECDSYGISGQRYADTVLNLTKMLGTRDVLDYGAGRCTLASNLPFPIQNYDPFIPELATRPVPADLVTNTDVLEHVEPEHLVAVLKDICSLSNKAAFFQIATRPASKILPDGRNAHLIIEPAAWWIKQLIPYFEPVSFQVQKGGFVFLGYPLKETA